MTRVPRIDDLPVSESVIVTGPLKGSFAPITSDDFEVVESYMESPQDPKRESWSFARNGAAVHYSRTLTRGEPILSEIGLL